MAKEIGLTQYKLRYFDWHFFRLTGYDWKKLKEIKEFLATMLDKKDYVLIAWSSGCAYRNGVALRNKNDVMRFKLIFQGYGADDAGDILDEIDEEEDY